MMTDFQKVFYNKHLRAVDKSSNLVSMTYFTAQTIATKMKDLEISSWDKFLQSLQSIQMAMQIWAGEYVFIVSSNVLIYFDWQKNVFIWFLAEKVFHKCISIIVYGRFFVKIV